MEYLIIPALAAGAMGWLFWRGRKSPALKVAGVARVMLWGGLGLQGLYAAFWLFFGLGEITASLTGGLVHLVPALGALVLIYTARRLPLEGGLVLAGESLLLAGYTAIVIDPGAHWLPAILFAAGPAMISGLLLLWAAALSLEASKK